MPTLGNMTATKTLLVTDNGPAIVDTAPEHAGEGDTLIHVSHSSVNYKDGMALAGNKGVVRTLPIVPGIDAVGTLEDGTLVTVNGWGIGERRNGGYTPELRIDAAHITRVPAPFDAWTAAAIGTAALVAVMGVGAAIAVSQGATAAEAELEGFRTAFRTAAVLSIGTLILGATLRATKAEDGDEDAEEVVIEEAPEKEPS